MHLYDLTLPELEAWMTSHGAPRYRARQIFHELYQRAAISLEAMTELPKTFRQTLANEFDGPTVATVESQRSEDGTMKWLSKLPDGQLIETVLIPARSRNTVCVSTQVGCAYGCAFCASGQAGFRRNLSPGEIVQQVLLVQRALQSSLAGPPPASGVTSHAQSESASLGAPRVGGPTEQLDEQAAPPPRRVGDPSRSFGARAGMVSAGDAPADERARESRPSFHAGETEVDPASDHPEHQRRGTPAMRVTNVVFMGMGEPLANYDNLLTAIRILNSPEGLKLGARKITISTVGLVPMIERLAKEGLQIELSISLHAPNDALRSRLMPVNTKYPIEQLMAACRTYAAATKRLLTFEYILIDQVNDRTAEAEQLATLLKGLLCKVNLIPCHPTPGTTWARPPQAHMLAFEKTLRRRGVLCSLRRSRGLDIDGACGQLRLRRLDAPASPAH